MQMSALFSFLFPGHLWEQRHKKHSKPILFWTPSNCLKSKYYQLRQNIQFFYSVCALYFFTMATMKVDFRGENKESRKKTFEITTAKLS